MAQGKYLQETLHSCGTNVGRDLIQEFEIKFRPDNEHKFQWLTKSCSCTTILSTTEEIKESGKIRVKFIVANSGVPTTPGTHQINRVVQVFFEDGEPDFITNPNGIRQSNPKKTSERFTITGTCLVPETKTAS